MWLAVLRGPSCRFSILKYFLLQSKNLKELNQTTQKVEEKELEEAVNSEPEVNSKQNGLEEFSLEDEEEKLFDKINSRGEKCFEELNKQNSSENKRVNKLLEVPKNDFFKKKEEKEVAINPREEQLNSENEDEDALVDQIMKRLTSSKPLSDPNSNETFSATLSSPEPEEKLTVASASPKRLQSLNIPLNLIKDRKNPDDVFKLKEVNTKTPQVEVNSASSSEEKLLEKNTENKNIDSDNNELKSPSRNINLTVAGQSSNSDTDRLSSEEGLEAPLSRRLAEKAKEIDSELQDPKSETKENQNDKKLEEDDYLGFNKAEVVLDFDEEKYKLMKSELLKQFITDFKDSGTIYGNLPPGQLISNAILSCIQTDNKLIRRSTLDVLIVYFE